VNAVTFRFTILLLAGIGLTACGFKLAGIADLPEELSAIYLSADSLSKSQQDQLRRQLTRAGAEFVNRDYEGAVTLMVSLKGPTDLRSVTSGSSGKKNERISLQLDYSLKSADGTLIVPAKTLQRDEDIDLNDDRLLASNQEKQRVILNLEKSLFDALIQQLIRI
jgi:LPS-assembly lipoprotein